MEERTPLAGKVVALWRYPIKSMQGKQLPVALLDRATGFVASAKHPGRWCTFWNYMGGFWRNWIITWASV
jgi:hypothetical protein